MAASVSSLDKDLRNMRLSKYTPQAANEVREWIEDALGDRLQGGDLLEALKDGVALCRLVNLAVSPGVKFKQSAMPFVQMENISHFLRACQMPPLSLQPHDVFLTVDLYEAKDPAQVLQCIAAFSRRANAIQPSRFPRTLGAKSKGGVMSPQLTGSSQGGYNGGAGGGYHRGRGASNASEQSNTTFDPTRPTATGRMSPSKNGGTFRNDSPQGGVTSWSQKKDEGTTAPAWNIHQYGYMGGASQGNQGIAFGARRQITSPAPAIPSLADKERRRREEESEADRRRLQAEEAEYKRRVEREAEEERAKAEEERKWAEETRRQGERERKEAEEEKRRWDAEERKWRQEEEKRQGEQREATARLDGRPRQRTGSDARLNGQLLSQYQAEQSRSRGPSGDHATASPGSDRVRELERQLEEAKAREQQYEAERQERLRHERHHAEAHDINQRAEAMVAHEKTRSRPQTGPKPGSRAPSATYSRQDSWREDERDYLRKEWSQHHSEPFGTTATPPPAAPAPLNVQPRPPPQEPTPPPQPPRPLPSPAASTTPSRPLPDPQRYTTAQAPPPASRTERYLASNPAPTPPLTQSHVATESAFSSTAEHDAENARRVQSQAATKNRGWASKSLLEREMERERERQREWEDGQKATADAVKRGVGKGDPGAVVGEGGAWDPHQYGWTGGDSQNRGGAGLGVGGARRQIIGPRPPP